MDEIWYIFTDGACSGNPGPGGWAAVIIGGGDYLEFGGGDSKTTNNRMEMTAVIEGLKIVAPDKKIVLWTDSSYLVNGLTKWIHGWRSNGWKKKDGEPVLNEDLWRELDDAMSPRIQMKHVKGHAGNYMNERCDKIAVAFSQRKQVDLRAETLDDASDKDEILEGLEAAKNYVPSKSPGSKKKPPAPPPGEAYKNKVYLFIYENKVHRFTDWPSCQVFASGKPGYTKGCRSRAEEEQYVKDQGLPVSALDSAVDHSR
ncbi:ribonuclease HI [bacterium]